ncbi:hypothetical protein BH09BAC5_BH09BAC5_13990 [soil metagenome]
MNLRKTILAEHSKSQANKIIKWVGEDKKRFAELVHLFLTGEYRVVQRSAWPISWIAVAHPALVKPYIGKFTAYLLKKDLHPAAYRNILRLLSFIDIPEKYQGKLVNICFDFLLKQNSPIAVKVFAMTVIKNIAKLQPELKRELKIVVEELMKEGSGGILSRGKKILKEIGEAEKVKRNI